MFWDCFFRRFLKFYICFLYFFHIQELTSNLKDSVSNQERNDVYDISCGRCSSAYIILDKTYALSNLGLMNSDHIKKGNSRGSNFGKYSGHEIANSSSYFSLFHVAKKGLRLGTWRTHKSPSISIG